MLVPAPTTWTLRMDREPPQLADELVPEPLPKSRGLIGTIRDTTFRSLRHRNYKLYFFGQIVSFTGSWIQAPALMWLMFDRTGDPRWPSWLLVAQVGPTIVLGPWGGALADRFHRVRLVFASQAVFLVMSLLLTFFVAANVVEAWIILTIQIICGVAQAVDLPARLALVQDLVPREDLINAVGLNSLLFNSARAIGPAVAAMVFAALAPFIPPGPEQVRIGAAACFGLNSLSFVAVLLALWAIHFPPEFHEAKSKNSGSRWDGVRYFLDHPGLGGLVLLTLVIGALGWPVLTLAPAFTKDVLGLQVEALNALVSGLGGGALIAALATATFGQPDRRKRFLITGAFATGIGLLGVTLSSSLPLAVIFTACTGFGLILYLSTGQAMLQLRVPDDRRGKVMALWAMTLSASAPIGHLLAGQAVTWIGVVNVLAVMTTGVLIAATGLAALVLRKHWRQE